jgi:hypothetical protein
MDAPRRSPGRRCLVKDFRSFRRRPGRGPGPHRRHRGKQAKNPGKQAILRPQALPRPARSSGTNRHQSARAGDHGTPQITPRSTPESTPVRVPSSTPGTHCRRRSGPRSWHRSAPRPNIDGPTVPGDTPTVQICSFLTILEASDPAVAASLWPPAVWPPRVRSEALGGAVRRSSRTGRRRCPGGPVAGRLEAIGGGPGAAVLEGVVGAGRRDRSRITQDEISAFDVPSIRRAGERAPGGRIGDPGPGNGTTPPGDARAGSVAAKIGGGRAA